MLIIKQKPGSANKVDSDKWQLNRKVMNFCQACNYLSDKKTPSTFVQCQCVVHIFNLNKDRNVWNAADTFTPRPQVWEKVRWRKLLPVSFLCTNKENTLATITWFKVHFNDRKKIVRYFNKLCVDHSWTTVNCQRGHMETQLMKAGVSRLQLAWKGVILHSTFKVDWIINGLAMETESCYQYSNTFTSNFRLALPDCRWSPETNSKPFFSLAFGSL